MNDLTTAAAESEFNAVVAGRASGRRATIPRRSSAFRFGAALALLLGIAAVLTAQPLTNERYSVEPTAAGAVRVTARDAGAWSFAATSPCSWRTSIRSRRCGRANPTGVLQHRVVAGSAAAAPAPGAKLRAKKRSAAQAGDGFDDRILEGDTKQRTADVFAAAPAVRVIATATTRSGDAIRFTLPPQDAFELRAELTLPAGDAEPVLAFTLTPRKSAWFSVGYTGAPAHRSARLRRCGNRSSGKGSVSRRSDPHTGVRMLAAGDAGAEGERDARRGRRCDEFPFQPLPLLENSRFGVALRNGAGEAQPMVFAPLLGGAESRREPGQPFYVQASALCRRGRHHHGLRGDRAEALRISRLPAERDRVAHETLDNMIDYGMSRYSWFVDELKGCAYSTDVPGAVKNVSSLNPLNIALVADDEEIFQRRAYPIVDISCRGRSSCSRSIRNRRSRVRARALKGPCAPVSELAALYGITQGASPVFRRFATTMLGRNRTLNLDDVSEGGSWQNQLALWSETGERRYLDADAAGRRLHRSARESAGRRLRRIRTLLLDRFRAEMDGPVPTPRSGGRAALPRGGAVWCPEYTMFTWVAPRIPEQDVTVNQAARCRLLVSEEQGSPADECAGERVPAWRLSEIGLTPESSGTMSGHRAIFMANYAPWMLRIAALTGDRMLHDVARSAVVGRYRNFPGYHINTARTTIYEGADYPLRDHRDLSVNSFHYNHIWPHMSICSITS